ncbi:MAG: hypothetical protein ACI30N_02190 [Muribaculaceae bacterium]
MTHLKSILKSILALTAVAAVLSVGSGSYAASPGTPAPDAVADSVGCKPVDLSGMAIIDDSKTMYPGG